MKSEIGNAVSLPRSHASSTHYCKWAASHADSHSSHLCYAGSLQLCLQLHKHTVRLTVEDLDGDWLFLLDGLCVREAGVADVVVPWILSENIREVKVSIERLGHPAALRQPLEVWNVQTIKYFEVCSERCVLVCLVGSRMWCCCWWSLITSFVLGWSDTSKRLYQTSEKLRLRLFIYSWPRLFWSF